MGTIEDKYIPADGEQCLEYMQYESGFYWIDEEHDGKIWVTSDMVKKYSLDTSDLFTKDEYLEEQLLDWGEGEDYEAEVNSLGEASHYIYIQYCTHMTLLKQDRDDSEKWIEDTIHGSIYSEEFLSWLNHFPIEILSEPGIAIQ